MLTRRMQIQAIADRPGRRSRRCWPPCGRQAGPGDAVLGAVLAAVPGERLAFPSLQEIAGSLPPTLWMWPAWIPLGMITLLGAVPGAGKSFLALDLARLVIAGEPFPDDSPQPLGEVRPDPLTYAKRTCASD